MNITASTRFWRKVNKTPTCWLWIGSITNGYGKFWYKGPISAHIFVYNEIIGPIKPGHDLHHKCEVKNCVNPAHLEEIPHEKHPKREQTHCKRGHEFTPENTYKNSYGKGRICKTCHIQRMKSVVGFRNSKDGLK